MLPIIHLKETISTNTFLQQLVLEQTVEEETVVITHNQTGGRGQRGNSWESEPGKNLTFSIILYPHLPGEKSFLISQMVSQSIKQVLDTYISDVIIKYPNDIYYQNKKIAGILIENSMTDGFLSQSIIGIGLNVNQEIFRSDAPNPVSLKQITGLTYDLNILLQQLIDVLMKLYIDLRDQIATA